MVNPATGKTVATIAEAREPDIDGAVTVADKAFRKGPWPRLSLELRLASRTLGRGDRGPGGRPGARATAQIGIPVSFSRAVSASAAKSLRDHIAWAREYCWEEDRSALGGIAGLRREPVGVVAAIVPWNFPALLGMNKMAPALAAGCTVVVKPSPEAPLDLLVMAECAVDAESPRASSPSSPPGARSASVSSATPASTR